MPVFLAALALPLAVQGLTVPPTSSPRSATLRIRSSAPLLAAASAIPQRAPSASKKEMIAEAIGTGLITLLGAGTVSAAILTGSHQGLWQIAATWGGTVALAAYATSGVSGAHLNPAVTLALTLRKGFPIAKAIGYMVAQLIGAIAGSAGVLACFGPAIKAFEAKNSLVRGTVGALSSAPGCMYFSLAPGGLSAIAACAVEGLQMSILMFAILSFTHKDSGAPPAAACGLIGMTVAVLISVFGPLTCAGFNPARDLGPRIVASLAGWGAPAFQGAWVYAVGPFVGALIGTAVHDALYEE